MRIYILFILIIMLACQSQNKNQGKTENDLGKEIEVVQSSQDVSTQKKKVNKTEKTAVLTTSRNNTKQENLECYAEVCLQLRNHDASKKSFEIYMINTVPVFGFQCDLPGINIAGSDGGLLQENEYQTSNSAFRILSFSMQARSLPAGGGVLTTIYYSEPAKEVCMTAIIFAGIGGSKLENDIPECLQLN